MNLLIIDDQTSVINGIKSGVNFTGLGIKQIFTADNAETAREILQNNTVHLMLCDIEMPGENGLVLNQWTADRYPDIIRILLTSHTEFSYAQQSIKLGCFDYIVQPAPYDVIEESLRRAISRIQTKAMNKRLADLGKFYSDNEPELLDRIVFNLYASNKDTVSHAMELLNQIGYPVSDQSFIQLLIFNIEEYFSSADSIFTPADIRRVILSHFNDIKGETSVYPLLASNKYHQYVLLIFCNDDSLLKLDSQQYLEFIRHISADLKTELACYVSEPCLFPHLRKMTSDLHKCIDDNVRKKSGLFFSTQNSFPKDSLDFSEYQKRWSLLLENEQLDTLCDNIISYIEFISAVNKTNFKTLCDLHQQLTQMFFNFSYANNIDITKLFTEAYSYTDYMDSFKDIQSLQKSVRFITQALQSVSSLSDEQSDVQKAKKYILDNISNNITVKDVADHVHLSPEYFTTLFKKETGQNIKNYILQVKIDIAKDLLGNPNIPISFVSLELGYTNFSHFTQMFKKYENITPSEYRKKVTGIKES